MQITQYTVAVTKMDAMVEFYNLVFDADIMPVEGTPFYRGVLAGVSLLFCPNSITNINAEKNRIQWQITVDDVRGLVAKAETHGGTAYGECHESDSMIAWGIADPDGNSIELMQWK
ncbi:MAG: VOC family protein [Chloroflexota bacterium]